MVAMYVYRLVGQILFQRTQDRRYLVAFPNFFLPMTFMFVAIHALPQNKHKFLAIGVIAAVKVLHEKYHHTPPEWAIEKIRENNHISPEDA
jgi:hypothetical protein